MITDLKKNMSNRLYYADSYQCDFDATIVGITSLHDKLAVVLSQSCFYPTSGGQPYDTGLLSSGGMSASVVDVVGEPGEPVLHLLESATPTPLLTVGAQVKGTIDWSRRYGHMQQHTAQHLLSHTFLTLFGYETVSVHFGATESTLDLQPSTPQSSLLTAEQLAAAEAYANDVVYQNIPVHTYFVTDAEIGDLPVRRPPKVSGLIRIVEIEKLDYSACGGTHCRQSGELGPIKLLKQEKSRGQVRLTFVSGKRALADYGQKHTICTDIAGVFSNEISQTPELVASLVAQNKELMKQISGLNKQLLGFRAVEFQQLIQPMGEWQLVSQHLTDMSVDDAKQLVSILQENVALIVLMVVQSGEKCTLLFARGENVTVHMGDLLKEVLNQFGGKGGGRPDFAQGGGAPGSAATAMLAAAIERLQL